jgi:probable HAF family extracellular repeat protein
MRIWQGAACSVVVAWADPAQATSYSMTDLGNLGGTITTVAGINSSGQITGNSLDAGGNSFAFLYANGHMTSLGNDNAVGVKARAINSSGVIEGNLSNGDLFTWSNGTFTDLGLAPGTTQSKGNGFNDSGEIAGQAKLTDGTYQAFLYNPANGGSFMLLGTLGGMPSSTQFSYASSINSSGQIEGDSINSNGDDHAYVWTNGSWNDLGTFGGPASSGIAVNNLGHATGVAFLTASVGHVFLYNGTKLIDCGTLGGNYGNAGGLNNQDMIVGYCELADNVTNHAFIYSNGVMTDLNTLIPANTGWTLTDARGINDAGDIAAEGTNAAGQQDSFLLTPIYLPEPTACAICAAAIPLLTYRRRRN